MTEEIDILRRSAREVNEIIFSAMLPRLKDDDGVEYVARDALALAVREHFLRRIRLEETR